MSDSAIEGQEITFLWDSPKDEKGNYIPYEQYVILIKHGSAFDTSDFAIHKMQARASGGFIFEIDGYSIADKGTGGYLTIDEKGEKLAKYQTYRIKFEAQQNGGYYFSVWSQRTLEGDRCGPVYYPGNTFGLELVAGEDFPQEPFIVSDVKSDYVSLDQSVSIYGLTAEGVRTSYTTSPSKNSGGGETKVILRGEHSPDFNYRAFIKSNSIGQSPEGTFSAKSRITIRKVSPNNTPSRTIYYLFPLGDIARYQAFEFPAEANSLEAVNGKLVNGLVVNPRDISSIPTYSYVTTEHLTEEMIPLRDFDIVVEAYDPATHATSAGNKLFDGWDTINTTKLSEGDFKTVKDAGTTNARREPHGYDILEVRLEPPSSLIMLDEYNDNSPDNDVTQEEAYDLKIPYLLEPKITNDKHLMVTLKTSTKGSETYLNAVDIFSTYFRDIKGMVLYYADEPFVLANEQIKVPEDGDTNRDDTKQVFEVEKDDGSISKIEVNRFFFLLKDLKVDPVLGTISAPLPKEMNTKKSNIVVGFFDTLLHQKHFDVNDTARQLASEGNIKTIYEEKNLNFSRVAVPVNKLSGNPRTGGTKNTFDPEKDLTLNSASIAIYGESLTDEDASEASCFIRVTDNGETVNIISYKNMAKPEVVREEPYVHTVSVNIHLKLNSEPIEEKADVITWEEYTDPESKEALWLPCNISSNPCGNIVADITTKKQSPYIQVKNKDKTIKKVNNFEIKIVHKLIKR